MNDESPVHRVDALRDVEALTGEVFVSLHRASAHDDPFNGSLKAIAEDLRRAPSVTVREGDDVVMAPLGGPALSVGDAKEARIHFHVVPEGPELKPFVEALEAVARGVHKDLEDEPEWVEGARKIDGDVELLVFVGPSCPHCPLAAREAISVAVVSPQVTVSIVDATRLEALARKFNVKAVPLTVIDSGLSFQGTIRAADLVDHILSRGTQEYQAALFASLVELGRHNEAARLLMDEGGSQIFLERWRKSALSERISLMIVAEEGLEEAAGALDPILTGLIELLGGTDPSLRGDTADLLGRTGHPLARAPLKALLDDPVADVAEVAEEALEELKESDRRVD